MDDDRDVRLLRPDEMRAAADLFRGALHHPPVSDVEWDTNPVGDCEGRTYGAFENGEMVGTTWSFATRTAVPGGATLPAAAVTRVGVRADRTRRGHLTAMMRTQLADAAAHGGVLAQLTASESVIYGRYGYGVATRGEHVRIRPRTGVRAAAPERGEIRMLPRDGARDVLVPLYERLAPARPGTMARNADWWTRSRAWAVNDGGVLETAVHTGPAGDDGYVVWTVDRGDDWVLRVSDLHAATPAAAAGLWRFLLGVDLVDRIVAYKRPLDESVDLLLTDAREVRVDGRVDELWVRLLDVPAALAARTWGDGPAVVLRVHDHLIPANDATFRIGPDGPKLVEGDPAPDLECDVDALAMAYLGDRRPSELVAAGWWRAHEPSAPARADALFATGVVPWCGTGF
ncbi:GNAT family N-acetyltransferase [Pseudonocardia endophytica]|uniref:Putative acetyltransferase n=1 Tax=Pseudonocardia endophytica TaxID=401976 RepID=A0A4R1HKZ6_PSEEN|nr:GNAT family N-acetyltransferase [Pseudonocardia endophytica]TCK23067.1 putative acetyltransferase [Pseudonocardia endophytica]